MSAYVNDILVYCEQDSIRLKYIVNELLESRASLHVHYTQSLQYFAHSEIKIKIAYAQVKPDVKCVHMKPNGLLSQSEIEPQQIEISTDNEWHHIFFTTHHADLPFDLFAAAFFLITRYEEYLPHSKDVHTRFDHTSSVAYKHGFLDFPLIDHWVMALVKNCELYFEVGIKHNKQFQFISTIDVDYAYLYKGIGIKRWWRKFVKSAANFRFGEMYTQLLVLVALKKDPYDTYDYVNQIAGGLNSKPLCFYLIGRTTDFDKNIEPDSFHLKPLLRRLSKYFIMGVHPSYNSYNSAKLVAYEKDLLQQKLNDTVVISRQHYLRFSIPHTYHILDQSGITDDFSMGYANHTGFRASTCNPFLFFNLQINKPEKIVIHPTCIMDTTLRYAMKLTPEKAMEQTQYFIDVIKKYHGDCILIWHNSSLSHIDGWQPWQKVYEAIHKQAQQL